MGSKSSKKNVKSVTLKSLPKKQRPKTKCCVSKSRCKRCPLQMLRDGTLPCGYTVKRRKLVRLEKADKALAGRKLKKAA